MLTNKERELILQWYQEGKTQQEIAELLNCHQSSVSRLLKKYECHGIVTNLPRSGRPTKLTNNVLNHLKAKLVKLMRKANENFSSISTKQVAEVIEKEIGISYSYRHIERLLHNMGFSLITPRPQHIRHDQQKVDKFRDDFKKNFNRSMWTVS